MASLKAVTHVGAYAIIRALRQSFMPHDQRYLILALFSMTVTAHLQSVLLRIPRTHSSFPVLPLIQ